jgi:hypothetical protein
VSTRDVWLFSSSQNVFQTLEVDGTHENRCIDNAKSIGALDFEVGVDDTGASSGLGHRSRSNGMEDSGGQPANIRVNGGIIGGSDEVASEGASNVVGPGRCTYKPLDRFDSLAHSEDIEFSGQIIGVDEGLGERIARCELDRST